MKKNAAVTTEIVRIGNSRGVRIPKTVLEQAGLAGKVSMAVSGGALVIRSARAPRQGWDDAFARARAQGPDAELWPDGMRNAFDAAEWSW